MAFELPVVDAVSLAAWCEEHLGSPAERELFRFTRSNESFGTRLIVDFDLHECPVDVAPVTSTGHSCGGLFKPSG